MKHYSLKHWTNSTSFQEYFFISTKDFDNYYDRIDPIFADVILYFDIKFKPEKGETFVFDIIPQSFPTI